MPVVAIAHLKALVPRGRRVIGLDIGAKTVGLALSDATLTIASALAVLRRGRYADDLARLSVLFAEQAVSGIVAGLPVSMDGSQGPQCQRVRQFARDLLQRSDLPLVFWDERWSTVAVERLLIEDADLSRRRRRQVVDRAAAAYNLQGALDAMRHAEAEVPGGGAGGG